MKKLLILAVMSVALVGCHAPTSIQHAKYGIVEDVVTTDKHHCRYKVKTWCSEDEKFYNVYTDRLPEVNSTILISR